MMTDGEVHANPIGEMTSNKDVANCKELHLAGRGITVLSNFERFKNLSVLWLNNNKLKDLSGLEHNFRVRSLYCHCNHLNFLGNSLDTFLSLNSLTLNDNHFDNMEDVLHSLREMKSLESLDLYNNPVAQEDNYRTRIIVELPSLEVLDKKPIDAEERSNAVAFHKRLESAINMKSQKTKFLTDEELAKEEERQRILRGALSRMKYHIQTYRIQLELKFLEHDPRKLGLIEEEWFWEILKEFGLEQLLDDLEKTALLSEYKRNKGIDSISVTGTIRKTMITYQKFCSEVLPKVLRFVADPWKLEVNNELSTTTKDLQSYVQKCSRKREREEYMLKQATLLASKAHNDDPNVFNVSKEIKNKCSLHHGLDPWVSAELSRIIQEEERGTDSSKAMLDKAQVEKVVVSMQQYGKVPIVPGSGGHATCGVRLFDHLNQFYISNYLNSKGNKASNKSNSSIPSMLLHFAIGSSCSSSYSNTQLSGFCVHADTNIHVVVGAILTKWQNMQTRDANSLEKKIFSDADSTFDQVLRAASTSTGKGGADPSSSSSAAAAPVVNVLELTKTAVTYSTVGTRLASKRVKEIEEKTWWAPDEVLASAPNRSDMLVIPNLRTTGNQAIKVSNTMSKSEDAGPVTAEEKPNNPWATHLAKLGMKGDVLTLALDRKERSLTKQMSKMNKSSTALNLGGTVGNDRVLTSTSTRKSAIPPPFDASTDSIKGWASTTGSIVLK